jgi:hypothetical protein
MQCENSIDGLLDSVSPFQGSCFGTVSQGVVGYHRTPFGAEKALFIAQALMSYPRNKHVTGVP